MSRRVAVALGWLMLVGVPHTTSAQHAERLLASGASATCDLLGKETLKESLKWATCLSVLEGLAKIEPSEARYQELKPIATRWSSAGARHQGDAAWALQSAARVEEILHEARGAVGEWEAYRLQADQVHSALEKVGVPESVLATLTSDIGRVDRLIQSWGSIENDMVPVHNDIAKAKQTEAERQAALEAARPQLEAAVAAAETSCGQAFDSETKTYSMLEEMVGSQRSLLTALKEVVLPSQVTAAREACAGARLAKVRLMTAADGASEAAAQALSALNGAMTSLSECSAPGALAVTADAEARVDRLVREAQRRADEAQSAYDSLNVVSLDAGAAVVALAEPRQRLAVADARKSTYLNWIENYVSQAATTTSQYETCQAKVGVARGLSGAGADPWKERLDRLRESPESGRWNWVRLGVGMSGESRSKARAEVARVKKQLDDVQSELNGCTRLDAARRLMDGARAARRQLSQVPERSSQLSALRSACEAKHAGESGGAGGSDRPEEWDPGSDLDSGRGLDHGSTIDLGAVDDEIDGGQVVREPPLASGADGPPIPLTPPGAEDAGFESDDRARSRRGRPTDFVGGPVDLNDPEITDTGAADRAADLGEGDDYGDDGNDGGYGDQESPDGSRDGDGGRQDDGSGGDGGRAGQGGSGGAAAPPPPSQSAPTNDSSYCAALYPHLPLGAGQVESAQQAKSYLASRDFSERDLQPTDDAVHMNVAPGTAPRASFAAGRKKVLNLNVQRPGKSPAQMPLLLKSAGTADDCDELNGQHPRGDSDPLELDEDGLRPQQLDQDGESATVSSGPIEDGWSDELVDATVDGMIGMIDYWDCFVATAVYRTADGPELRSLRAFRDDFLLASDSGTRLVALYYRVGPRASAWLKHRPRVRAALRPVIDRVASWVGRLPRRRSALGLGMRAGLHALQYGLERTGVFLIPPPPIELFNPLDPNSSIPVTLPVASDDRACAEEGSSEC